MKEIVDPEYIGNFKMYSGIPLDIGKEEEDKLKQAGYRKLKLPCIQALGERENMQISLGVNLKAVSPVLAELLVERYSDLPICLYTIDDLDGGITLVPFRFVEGTVLSTNAKTTNNKRLMVDLIEEPRVKIL